MAVKGSYLALTAVGIVAVWSGLTGRNWSAVLRNALSGQPLTSAPVKYPIKGAPVLSGSSSYQSGKYPVTAPTSASQRAWAVAQLAAIGAPPTPANINSLSSWANKESPWNSSPPDGAQYTHNPLNTTLQAGAVGEVNSVNVAVYPNWVVGIRDTAQTLAGYPEILSLLRSGKGLCGQTLGELSTWSGGGYDSVC